MADFKILGSTGAVVDSLGKITQGLGSPLINVDNSAGAASDLQAVTDAGSATTNSITATAFVGDGSGLTNLPSSGAAGIYTIESSSAGGTGAGNAAVKAWLGCQANNSAVARMWQMKHNTDDGKVYGLLTYTVASQAVETLATLGFGAVPSGFFGSLVNNVSCPPAGSYFPIILESTDTYTDTALLPAIGFAAEGGLVYLGAEYGSSFTPDTNEIILGNNATANSRGVAIGESASAGSYTVAVGQGSNSTGQWGVSIGYGAVTTGSRSVSVGQGAAASGNSSVAVGNNAKTGANSVSVGASAGATSQGSNAIAMGGSAGANTQGAYAVAIGSVAGGGYQGANSVAIGNNAGYSGLGPYSVALGAFAGQSSQAANSIVINASGSSVGAAQDTFVVKPVRDVAGTIPTGFKQVAYNPTTGEFISYG